MATQNIASRSVTVIKATITASILFAGLLLAGCNPLDALENQGSCYDAETGEELKEVKGADGTLFELQKTTDPVWAPHIDYCGVSVRAAVFEADFADYVLHPTPFPFKRIEVGDPYKGLRPLRGYEWY